MEIAMDFGKVFINDVAFVSWKLVSWIKMIMISRGGQGQIIKMKSAGSYFLCVSFNFSILKKCPESSL